MKIGNIGDGMLSGSVPPYRPSPTTLIGAVVGGASILSLLTSTTPLQLFEQLAEWLNAYNQLVETVSNRIFGWLDWRWISISRFEANVLIISLVMSGAIVRASAAARKHAGETN